MYNKFFLNKIFLFIKCSFNMYMLFLFLITVFYLLSFVILYPKKFCFLPSISKHTIRLEVNLISGKKLFLKLIILFGFIFQFCDRIDFIILSNWHSTSLTEITISEDDTSIFTSYSFYIANDYLRNYVFGKGKLV